MGDVVGLRRARVGVEGTVAETGRYVNEIDLASGELVIRDLFGGIGAIDGGGQWRVGHFLEPFSLELDTSDAVAGFMERSPVNTLDPERSWGLGWYQSSDAGRTLAVGLFQSGTDVNDFQGCDGSAAALTSRLTIAPINEDEGSRLLHLGGALSARLPESGVITINQRPRSSLIDFVDSARSTFVPTTRVPAQFQQLANLQCAFVRGPFWTEAEWYGSWIDQRGDAPLFFHGYHVDCGYFLTGEHRAYLGDIGVFGPVRVTRPVFRCRASRDRPRGCGAWECVARFSYLDFQDSDTPLGPNGELVDIRLPQATLGVNWYWTDHLRLMFNYSYSRPDEPNSGTNTAELFAGRLGVFW